MSSGFIGYGRQWIDEDDIAAVVNVLRSDYLTQGPAVEAFERDLCRATGAAYCIAVANGTAALHLAVGALNLPSSACGITSTNSFVASANCLVYNGLLPVLADIDERSYNIDVNDLALKMTDEVRVVIPVHFAGQAAAMPAIAALAGHRGCRIIEDAAHAIGSRYADNSPVGNCRYSDMTTFSFHPVKTITSGEGGAITTNSRELYERLLIMRTHGIMKSPRSLRQQPGPWYYEMQILGYNYRLTDIQAALGSTQLRKLDRFVRRRREIVKRYNDAFAGLAWLVTPYEAPDLVSAFHLYVVRIDFGRIGMTRAEMMERLREKGIGTQVHYIPIHTQPFYQERYGFRPGHCPVAERYYEQALSLPLYPAMTDEDTDRVIAGVLAAGA